MILIADFICGKLIKRKVNAINMYGVGHITKPISKPLSTPF